MHTLHSKIAVFFWLVKLLVDQTLQKRDEACHFSVYKRKVRQHPSQGRSSESSYYPGINLFFRLELKKEPSDSEAWAFTPAHPWADLFIDRLLQSPASEVRLSDECRILTVSLLLICLKTW